MKAISCVIIVLLLCACSYSEPVYEAATEIQAEASPSSAATAAEEELIAASSALEATTIAPTATPFERKNVMDSPKIVIYKSERMLYVYDNDEICAKIKIVMGFAPEGHKEKQGDGKTPEGEYYVCTRNDESKYHLALGLSYPNIKDAQAGLDSGLISQSEYDKIAEAIENSKRPPWDTALGGEIMIHGGGTATDWTAGCISMEDSDMDYVWENCPMGTPVTIYP